MGTSLLLIYCTVNLFVIRKQDNVDKINIIFKRISFQSTFDTLTNTNHSSSVFVENENLITVLKTGITGADNYR